MGKKFFYTVLFITISTLFNCALAQKSKGSLYFFHGTDDVNFCDKDSLIGSDCITGNIYLTDAGKAIYIYYCCCDNPRIYNIGSYIKTDNKITCTFVKEYEEGKKVKKITSWKLELAPINCKEFQYSFTEESDNGGEKRVTKYAVKKETLKDKKYFLKEVRNFKQLGDL